ncbi:fluoride efflux transporter CrcB [Arthrobacter sp. TMN-37]
MNATVVALAAAGGLGAGARFLLDGMISSRVRSGFPLGTVLINVTGSFLLGLLAGLAASAVLPPSAVLVAGTGFLGGYTTFSTASVDTLRLLRAGRRTLALVSALGTLAGALGAAALGFALTASA